MKILGTSAFWVVNKQVAKAVGFEASLLLSHLIDKETFFGVNDDGYFYCTCEQIEKDLFLSKYEQAKLIKKLEKQGFIETKIYGLPARKHFKILTKNILKFLQEEQEKAEQEDKETFKNKSQNDITYRGKKTSHLACKKLDPNNNIYNNKINNNYYIINDIITEQGSAFENFEDKNIGENINNSNSSYIQNSEDIFGNPFEDKNQEEPRKEKEKSSAKKEKEKYIETKAGSVEILGAEKIQYGNKAINDIIEVIKEELKKQGLFYQKEGADRNYAKHICTAREFGEIAEQFGMNREQFVRNIIKLAGESEFWRGKICNPRSLYKGYVKVLNEASSKMQEAKRYEFDLTKI